MARARRRGTWKDGADGLECGIDIAVGGGFEALRENKENRIQKMAKSLGTFLR